MFLRWWTCLQPSLPLFVLQPCSCCCSIISSLSLLTLRIEIELCFKMVLMIFGFCWYELMIRPVEFFCFFLILCWWELVLRASRIFCTGPLDEFWYWFSGLPLFVEFGNVLISTSSGLLAQLCA